MFTRGSREQVFFGSLTSSLYLALVRNIKTSCALFLRHTIVEMRGSAGLSPMAVRECLSQLAASRRRGLCDAGLHEHNVSGDRLGGREPVYPRSFRCSAHLRLSHFGALCKMMYLRYLRHARSLMFLTFSYACRL